MLDSKQFSELEDTHLNVDFALRGYNFKRMVDLLIYLALPKRGKKLRVLNQHSVI